MGKKGKLPAFWTEEVDMEPFMKLKVVTHFKNSFQQFCRAFASYVCTSDCDEHQLLIFVVSFLRNCRFH
jgi:hypothetical protein